MLHFYALACLSMFEYVSSMVVEYKILQENENGKVN